MANSPSKEITFSSDGRKSTSESTLSVSGGGGFSPPANPSVDPNFGKILGLTITPDLFPVIGNTFQVDASIVGNVSEMRVEFNYNNGWNSTNLPFNLTAAGETDEVQTVSLRTVGGSEVILSEKSETITLAGSDTDFVRILSASITGGVYGSTAAGTTLSYELNKTEGVTVNTKWYISPPESWKLS
tara:strand:+ start:368 stop:925 length:558 start_codon:yes stop_codon:yes gene_type:complete